MGKNDNFKDFKDLYGNWQQWKKTVLFRIRNIIIIIVATAFHTDNSTNENFFVLHENQMKWWFERKRNFPYIGSTNSFFCGKKRSSSMKWTQQQQQQKDKRQSSSNIHITSFESLFLSRKKGIKCDEMWSSS